MKRIQKEWNYGVFNPFPFHFYFFNKFKCFIICYIIILNLINICFTKCIYFLVKFLRYDCVFYIYLKWLFFMSKYSKRKKIKQRWKYLRYSYLTYPFLPPPKKKTSNDLKLQSFGNTNICILHLHCFTLI